MENPANPVIYFPIVSQQSRQPPLNVPPDLPSTTSGDGEGEDRGDIQLRSSSEAKEPHQASKIGVYRDMVKYSIFSRRI